MNANKRIVGVVNKCEPQQIIGWLADLNNLQDHLEVKIVIDGQDACSVIADKFRKSLAEDPRFAGTQHAFSVKIPAIYFDGKSHNISVIAAQNGQVLRNAPIDLVLPKKIKRPQNPIFVIGSPRSGTSILGNMLRSVLQTPGHAESHVMPLLHSLLHNVDDYFLTNAGAVENKAMFLAKTSPDYFKNQLRENFKNLYQENIGSFFIDKTPGFKMIEAVPSIVSVWPDAKFIFAKRRGIENVFSRSRKWPNVPFAGHCADWSGAMSAWIATKETIPACNRIEIDQADILNEPMKVSSDMVVFLGLDKQLIATMHEYFITQHPEKTQDNPAKAYMDIDETGWTDKQKAIFMEKCADIMNLYNYPLHK